MPPPKGRKTHIIRILGTNRQGERLDDVWADVERIDAEKGVSSDDNGTVISRKHRWQDDPDSNDYNPDGNPARKVTTIKLSDPEEPDQDFEDPDEWIPIDIIDRMQTRFSEGYRPRKEKNLNTAENTRGRDVELRRVYHYDTNIDDAADDAFEDQGRKVYVVEGADGHGDRVGYDRDLSTKDKDQYIEVEVPKRWNTRLNNELRRQDSQEAMGPQTSKPKLRNEYLIDDSEPAKLETTGPDEINPPYRLDQWQYIVNINWGGLAVEFQDGVT